MAQRAEAPTPEIANPYLDRFLEAGGSAEPDGDWWKRLLENPLATVDGYLRRNDLVAEYAWAVPTTTAIQALVDLGPLVEIGAGAGYWASLIAEAGGDVVAYDLYPPHGKQENSFGHKKAWHQVLYGGATAARRHPDRALFLCWPPYNNRMAERALKTYRGNRLAFIGEGSGGCTATDAFFKLLERCWQQEHSVGLPQWPGVHDDLTIYRRAA